MFGYHPPNILPTLTTLDLAASSVSGSCSRGCDGSRRLRIDRNRDRFDHNARDAIAELCVAKSGFGVWFPPLKGGEAGHMDLIEVILPKHALCWRVKTGRQALAEFLERILAPPTIG
jgi:hypothetical protein